MKVMRHPAHAILNRKPIFPKPPAFARWFFVWYGANLDVKSLYYPLACMTKKPVSLIILLLSTAIFILAGYSKPKKIISAENLIWSAPQDITEWGLPDILIVQVSDSGTAFVGISAASYPSEKELDKVKRAEPLDLSSVYERIIDYKKEVEGTDGRPCILITGDDTAKCDAFIKVLNDAKRANIRDIALDTIWRKPGDIAFGYVSHLSVWFVQGKKPDVTITITDENTLKWDNQPVTLDQYIHLLSNYTNQSVETERERIVIVKVSGNANYSCLRYVLDQLWRSRTHSVTVCLLR